MPENVEKRFDHAELGLLRFHFTNLCLSQKIGVRLVTYTPWDVETAAKLVNIGDLEPRTLGLSA